VDVSYRSRHDGTINIQYSDTA